MLRIARRLPKKRSQLAELYKIPELKLYGPIRRYSNKSKEPICPPKKQTGSGAIYTVGAIALIGGATLGYAKYDPEFRDTLVTYAPFTDTIIKFVFLEENVFGYLSKAYESMKKSVGDALGAKKSSGKDDDSGKTVEYKGPAPIIPALEKDVKKNKEDSYTEIRMEKKDKAVEIVGDAKAKAGDKTLKDTDIRNLADLETQIISIATEGVNAFRKAIAELKAYNRQIATIIDESVDQVKSSTWDSIREKSKKKNETIKYAEEKANQAIKNINKLREIINRPDFEADPVMKEMVKINLQKVQDDINNAKKEFTTAQRLSGATEKYWDKVQASRKHFNEELEALFPSINLSSKKLNVNPDDLDLFMLHAYSTVLFYQKELAKMEAITHEKLQAAIETARKGGGEPLDNAQICEAVERERIHITQCFQKQCLKIKQDAEIELREQLKRQSQSFTDHLDEAIKTRAEEIERELTRKFEAELEAERCNYRTKLAAMIGRLRGLDYALKVRDDADKTSKQAQALWSACQALLRAVQTGCPGIPWKDQLRPLDAELSSIQKASVKGDELVTAVIKGIPSEAKDRGVFPEDALRERFLKVEQVARTMALVPEDGAALPVYILSYIQSMLLINSASPIPQCELNNEVIDFTKLNTNEILQRARYWLDRGNFAQTLKYMNLLKGAPRSVARQWMNETRILLETQQAANTLLAHAASSGLMYL